MSSHSMQDNNEGYNKLLRQLSAEDEMQNQRGEVELVILKLLCYYKYMSVQRFENIQKS